MISHLHRLRRRPPPGAAPRLAAWAEPPAGTARDYRAPERRAAAETVEVKNHAYCVLRRWNSSRGVI